jgi:uncharacterized protein
MLEPRILSYGRSSPLFGVCSPRTLKCKLGCGEISGAIVRIRSKIPEMIDKALLEILVCPVCKAPLTEKNDALKCNQCRRVYPVRDNIPIMLVDQATIDGE